MDQDLVVARRPAWPERSGRPAWPERRGRPAWLVVVAVAVVLGVGLVTGPAGAAPAPGAVDLGTLGGTRSQAVAVSGRLVVGWAEVAGGTHHAFAYDLAEPAGTRRMRDLGTLGGAASEAVAVSGRLVVGWAEVAGGAHHGFAYDLGVPAPLRRMLDLRTLGGAASEAVAVSGRLVVGWSEVAAGVRHAFAFDLGAPPSAWRPRDLGTLGGVRSQAVAVSGRLIVGWAATAGNRSHPFAYDLSAPSPSMRDLGTLGGDNGQAAAVNGGVVVGSSATTPGIVHDGDPAAFVINVAASAPRMVALTAGDRFATASAVGSRFVVGYRASGVVRGFAYDMATRALVDLPPLGGTDSQAKAVSGHVVAGWATTAAEVSRAAVWTVP